MTDEIEIKYIPAAGHLSKYFAQLLAAPIYADDPADTVDIQIQKVALQLQVLHQIKAAIGTPGFQAIETNCTVRIRELESQLIWTAIREGKTDEVATLAGEHEALLSFFKCFDPIDEDIARLQEYLNRLKGRSQDNPAGGY